MIYKQTIEIILDNLTEEVKQVLVTFDDENIKNIVERVTNEIKML